MRWNEKEKKYGREEQKKLEEEEPIAPLVNFKFRVSSSSCVSHSSSVFWRGPSHAGSAESCIQVCSFAADAVC